MLQALDRTLKAHEGTDSSSFIDSWYRSAAVAGYADQEAAAAYLGAYGPRSILKIQEAMFALLRLKGQVRKHTTILDYGAGPCVGFAALVDLWMVLKEATGCNLELRYLAADRAPAMRLVGRTFCEEIGQRYGHPYHEVLATTDKLPAADCLIAAHVFNEGEGNVSCNDAIKSIIATMPALKDIVIIEPATEQVSRQMCSLGNGIPGLNHIGPCPHSGEDCREWSFRQFTKRVYACERRCLGQWAPGCKVAKYSLGLMSFEASSRSLGSDNRVVIGQPRASNCVMTCRLGDKRVTKISPDASPWDVVSPHGDVENWWP
jgi:ribosomal protein RSM22 (predicted rRNA methylase)